MSLDGVPKAPVINHENVLLGTLKIKMLFCVFPTVSTGTGGNPGGGEGRGTGDVTPPLP